MFTDVTKQLTYLKNTKRTLQRYPTDDAKQSNTTMLDSKIIALSNSMSMGWMYGCIGV